MQQHLAGLALDGQRGLHDGLRAGVVPVLARRFLVVPAVLARLGIQRHDGTQEQVVAATGAALLPRHRRAIARAHIDQLELRVIGNRIPGRAAAAQLPPLARPGLGRHRHGGVLEAFRRVAGHGIKLPQLLARVRVIGGDKAAHAQVCAAIADHDLVAEHPRCAGDRVRPCLVEGLHAPVGRTGLRIERDQPAIERGDEDTVLPERQAPRHRLAAGVTPPLAGHLRIKAPQQLARDPVMRGGDVPGAGVVEDAVERQRRGLDAAQFFQVVVPGQAELAHVLCADLAQRAVALRVVGAAIHEPVLWLAGRVAQALGVYRSAKRRRLGRCRLAAANRQAAQQQQREPERGQQGGGADQCSSCSCHHQTT